MLYVMNIGKLKAGFARAAKDPEMIAMAEEGIEKFEIGDVAINKWRRKLIQRYRESLEGVALRSVSPNGIVLSGLTKGESHAACTNQTQSAHHL